MKVRNRYRFMGSAMSFILVGPIDCANYYHYYRSQTKLREGNVFTGVCLSRGGGGGVA